MLSQVDLQASHKIAVAEVSPEDGELKTLNPKKEPRQRSKVTERGSDDTTFSIEASLATCVHGYLKPDRQTPASLIVLHFVIQSDDSSSIVKSARTSFFFKLPGEVDEKDSHATINVMAFAPGHRRFNKSTSKKTKKRELEFEAGGEASPAKADGKYSEENKEVHTQPYFEKMDAGRRYVDPHAIHDKVWWRVTQNKSHKLGITPEFRTAILVTRKDASQFHGIFRLKIDGGVKYNLSEKYNDWRGKSVVDDPVIFDPSFNPHGVENCNIEIKSDSLGELIEDEYILRKDLLATWGCTDWDA